MAASRRNPCPIPVSVTLMQLAARREQKGSTNLTDYYLVTHSFGKQMDFYLRPEDGVLFVDEPGRDDPFMVEPEAVHALLTYLEERREVIERAQRTLIQQKMDLEDMGPPYSEVDTAPRFKLVEFE
jgi:hypothetical protein